MDVLRRRGASPSLTRHGVGSMPLASSLLRMLAVLLLIDTGHAQTARQCVDQTGALEGIGSGIGSSSGPVSGSKNSITSIAVAPKVSIVPSACEVSRW